MRNILIVARFSIRSYITKPSYWFLTLVMPMFILGVQIFNTLETEEIETNASEAQANRQLAELPQFGIVDPGELIKFMPPELPGDKFTRFDDLQVAFQSLKDGEVTQVILIPPDFQNSGKITIYDQNFRIRMDGKEMGLAFGGENSWILTYLLSANLTGDGQLALILRNPTPGILAEQQALKPRDLSTKEGTAQARMVANWMPYIFYFVLFLGASYLLQSVTTEKENRTAEILLLSLEPRQLMIGKVLGLGTITLIQLIFWIGGAAIFMGRNTSMLGEESFSFPPGFFLWAAVYLVFGYLLYGSILAAAGAVANTVREAQQINWLLIIPLMPTLLFSSEFAENPNGLLPVILSLFPFSAPSAMVTRLSVTEVPFWQLAFSLAGLIVCAYFFIWMAARLFRADNLLSNLSFSWKRLLTGWRGT